MRVAWKGDFFTMLRRSIPVVAALVTLVAPLAALAIDTASVTTGPAGAAPTLTTPLIGLLALVLTGIAVYQLRRSAVGKIAVLVLVAAVTMAGLSYAGSPNVTVSGPNCARQAMQSYVPTSSPILLTNDCPTPIHILAIQISCVDPPPLSQPCSVGQTLASGETCILPSCAI